MPGPTACDCGRVIEQPSRGRPRKRCAVCSPVNRRRPLAVVRPAAESADPEPRAVPRLVRALLDELVPAGRDGTPEGILAVDIAERLSDFSGTASQYATLVREFHATKAAALAGAADEPGADVITGIFGT